MSLHSQLCCLWHQPVLHTTTSLCVCTGIQAGGQRPPILWLAHHQHLQQRGCAECECRLPGAGGECQPWQNHVWSGTHTCMFDTGDTCICLSVRLSVRLSVCLPACFGKVFVEASTMVMLADRRRTSDSPPVLVNAAVFFITSCRQCYADLAEDIRMEKLCQFRSTAKHRPSSLQQMGLPESDVCLMGPIQALTISAVDLNDMSVGLTSAWLQFPHQQEPSTVP